MIFLTKANNGRKIGKLGIANALRDGEAGDGEARYKVGNEEAQCVIWEPLEDGDVVLDPFNNPPRPVLLLLDLPERIIREERLLQPGFEFCVKPSLGCEVHPMMITLMGIVAYRTHDGV